MKVVSVDSTLIEAGKLIIVVLPIWLLLEKNSAHKILLLAQLSTNTVTSEINWAYVGSCDIRVLNIQ